MSLSILLCGRLFTDVGKFLLIIHAIRDAKGWVVQHRDESVSFTLKQVYAKLTEARRWENWLGIAQLVHTAQIEQLQPGNTFCYTSNLAPGFIDAIVQDAEPGKVDPLLS